MHNRQLILRAVPFATLACICGQAGSAIAQGPEVPAEKCCPQSDHTTPACIQDPYSQYTTCWTSSKGPSSADLYYEPLIASANMLACDGGNGPYALCAYSGPPEDLSNSGIGSLRCMPDGTGFADCTCLVVEPDGPYGDEDYFVAAFSILNLCYYEETMKTCQWDGSTCNNMSCPDSDCVGLGPAPACSRIDDQGDKNQNGDPFWSYDDADLVSVFSLAYEEDYDDGSKQCRGVYAGCMTAACAYDQDQEGTGKIQCKCPLYDGPYEIIVDGADCAEAVAGDWVWSSAHAIDQESTDECIPSGVPARSAAVGGSARP